MMQLPGIEYINADLLRPDAADNGEDLTPTHDTVARLVAERDALRAEVERLAGENDTLRAVLRDIFSTLTETPPEAYQQIAALMSNEDLWPLIWPPAAGRK